MNIMHTDIHGTLFRLLEEKTVNRCSINPPFMRRIPWSWAVIRDWPQPAGWAQASSQILEVGVPPHPGTHGSIGS